jgi:F0F1-type ATP synthase beta subunit
MEELSEEDKLAVSRARLFNVSYQPFHVAEFKEKELYKDIKGFNMIIDELDARFNI